MHSAINYQNICSPVFGGKKREVKVAAMGSAAAVGSNDSIRFCLPGEGLLDPWSSYWEVTINFPPASLLNDAVYTNKIIQIDGGIDSIFKTQILYCGATELERYSEFDVLTGIMRDMHVNAQDRQLKQFEGMGNLISSQLPNPVTTTIQSYAANTGALLTPLNWQAQENMGKFIQIYNTGAAFGTVSTSPASNFNATYTQNHMLINNQFAPFPNYNPNALCFNGGSDTTEYDQYFPFNSNISPEFLGNILHYSPPYSSTCMEPCFSSTVLQRYLKNGFCKTDYITSATFYFPVKSSYMGVWLPAQHFKLLPLWLMKGLAIDVQLNEYAFFTSWFSNSLGNRSYYLSGISLHLTLIDPVDAIKAQVQAEYEMGIKIPSHSFQLGPRQAVASGAIPPTIQVNNSYESLKNIFIVFIPNDYTSNSAARKNYRLSMGVTSLQVRIGLDYFPESPISGNGGTNFGIINNYDFVKHLYRCLGKHCHAGSCAINPNNFAISCRAFDPTVTSGPLFDNRQACFFEENRIVGKCVYGINLETVNYDGSTCGGVSTVGRSPFNLELAYDSTKSFMRPVTMMVFLHHDTCLEISAAKGVRTVGKN